MNRSSDTPGSDGPSTATTTRSEPWASRVSVRWVLLGVMMAMLLAMLDNMIVGTAMPTIVGQLGGLSELSWVAGSSSAPANAVATRA